MKQRKCLTIFFPHVIGAQLLRIIENFGSRIKHMWKAIRRWVYGGVAPDPRFRDCQLDLTTLEKKRLPGGAFEVCLDGVPFHVYDLRPSLKRCQEIIVTERERGDLFLDNDE